MCLIVGVESLCSDYSLNIDQKPNWINYSFIYAITTDIIVI